MTRRQVTRINRVCATVPLNLSVLACVWVLGNVAGGARSGAGERTGFHVFWFLILAQVPFGIGFVGSADWSHGRVVAARLAVLAGALALAFAPVAYFRL